jgi:large subunit ribosomal protein L13
MNKHESTPLIVVNAAQSPVGRIASYTAKQALLGKEVRVVQCAQALLSGRRRMVIHEYLQSVLRGGHSLKGPKWSKRSPERIMKRTIRGMLSHKMGRGEAAFARIRCYDALPAEYATTPAHKLPAGRGMTLAELAKEL